jgi:hypothetical protein
LLVPQADTKPKGKNSSRFPITSLQGRCRSENGTRTTRVQCAWPTKSDNGQIVKKTAAIKDIAFIQLKWRSGGGITLSEYSNQLGGIAIAK